MCEDVHTVQTRLPAASARPSIRQFYRALAFWTKKGNWRQHGRAQRQLLEEG
jgi:hypothetical protein